MSSTNRGRDRQADDYYRTPEWAIDDFLSAFYRREPGAFPRIGGKKMFVLDPCAGGDADHPTMPYPTAIHGWGTDADHTMTIDIREDSPAKVHGDYLTYPVQGLFTFDMIISNPPFTLAQQFIEKALTEVRVGGWVVFLLRLNFLGSQKRKPFWDTHMPNYIFLHSRRLSFRDDNKTDSVEYAHFCWQRGNTPIAAQLEVI
jgi:hypothetical protein